MEKLISKYDLNGYTLLKNVLIDLNLINKDYTWLICDFEAVPNKKEIEEFIYKDEFLLISTSKLVEMLEEDNFQWIWGVFSAIPSKYSKEEILNSKLPHIQYYGSDEYNPYEDEPKLQHPLAEFELYAVDSTYMFIVSNNNELLEQFKSKYPKFISK